MLKKPINPFTGLVKINHNQTQMLALKNKNSKIHIEGINGHFSFYRGLRIKFQEIKLEKVIFKPRMLKGNLNCYIISSFNSFGICNFSENIEIIVGIYQLKNWLPAD